MTSMGKRGKEELEAVAAAFLAEAESPRASDRLRHHGLQRTLARAKAAEAGKAPATARRAYRNPALLRHALVVAMVVLLVMLVSTSGAYAFSLGAQPDSPLYGAKIFFERARVTLTSSSAGDIRLEMGFSERRMEELQNMVSSSNRGGAERWLREYSRNIEGAGILFETVSDQESEQLSPQFQEMLDLQAQMMQGMRQGQTSGLSEPIEGAYHVCDQERARMRGRCGQQDPGGAAREPGGQQGQGDCPNTGGSSLKEGSSSSTGIEPASDSAGSEESFPPSDAPGGTPPDATMEAPADAPAGTPQPKSAPSSEGGQTIGDTEYGGESPHGGHIP
jgi:hypothetical protein